MAEQKRYKTNGIAEGLTALGDGLSGVGGLKTDYYGTFLASQDRRMQLEQELQRAAQAQAWEQYKQEYAMQNGAADRGMKLMELKEASKQKYAEMGMRPIDPLRATSPGGRLPSKMTTGAFGQAYVPSQSMANASLDMYAKKSDMILQRQLARAADERAYRESEDSPLSADAAGRYEFANEALRNIPKLRTSLFPDGTPGSFRRDIATKMMTPWKYPNDTEVQNTKRWLLSVATGRGLIQSGTVVKDNEWSRLMQQMGVDVASAPEAVYSSLGEQEEFMNGFKRSVRPGASRKGGSAEKESTGGKTQTFSIGGKTYNVPADQVAEFKKDMGLK